MQLKKQNRKEDTKKKKRVIPFNQPFRKYEKTLKLLSERLRNKNTSN